MEVIIQENQQATAEVAARIIAKLVREKPNAVLGLATGSTPLPVYELLIAMDLDWSQITTFNLDEYIGLAQDHPQSYHTFMWENVFSRINIKKENVHIPDGSATDISAYCQHYEDSIKAAGGIDLQILGIGTDGHIGFNEPTSSLVSRTRIKTLTEQTRRDNARFFDSEKDVPIHTITMGIGTIMDARQTLLIAYGENKADAIAAAVEGPISATNPASILQMHQIAKICIDQAAASKLTRADYFHWVYNNKPEWQQV